MLQQNLQSGVGTRIPDDAHARQRVFLCVMPAHTRIMVVQAGQPKGWPVSFGAGIPTPVWATTINECRNSGGGNKLPSGVHHVPVQIRGDLSHRP